jgi:hypothetical protein
MRGAELEYDLSGELLLARSSALGERLHPRLDALQTPDVGDRPDTAATLGSVELARSRASRRAGSRSRHMMRAAAAATGRQQRECGDGERQSPRHREPVTEPQHPDRG